MAKISIRPIRIEGNLAFVPLTKGYEVIIDACDVPLVEEYNWYAYVKKNATYAMRKTPHDTHGKQQSILMHRVLMHRVLMDAPNHLDVNHIDSDGLNNRRSTNLRLATKAQNSHNRRISSFNKSGIKGVYWFKRDQKWAASIRSNGKSKFLGLFTDISDASEAYATASAEMHGEFGRTA